MWQLRKENWISYFRQRKPKRLQNLSIWTMLGMTNYLTNCFYLWGVGKKVLLTVIMMSNDKKVRSCSTVVRRAFCLRRSLCPFLASRLATVSLDRYSQVNRWYKCDHAVCFRFSVHAHLNAICMKFSIYCEVMVLDGQTVDDLQAHFRSNLLHRISNKITKFCIKQYDRTV